MIGGVSFHTPIADMLEPLGWRGHFFITTGRLGQPGFLTSAQVRELHARPCGIGTLTRMQVFPSCHGPVPLRWTPHDAHFRKLATTLALPSRQGTLPVCPRPILRHSATDSPNQFPA